MAVRAEDESRNPDRFHEETAMFIQDLDSTASYRTLARGHGSGFARAYQASQRASAGSGAAGRSDLGGMRQGGAASAIDAPRAEQRRFRA